MKNWKTTLMGISALALMIFGQATETGTQIDKTQLAAQVALAVGALLAKDGSNPR